MALTFEINPGEIKINIDEPRSGKITFAEIGLTEDQLMIAGGNLRLDIELGQTLQSGHFYQMPTVEFSYKEKIKESSWQIEFNGEVVLDKVDHSGHKTVLFVSRKKLEDKVHHHVNRLIVHGDLAQEIHLSPTESYIHLF